MNSTDPQGPTRDPEHDRQRKREMRSAELPFQDITILTQYYAPEPGAPQIRLRTMANELRQMGVRVRVVTGMPNYPLGETFEGYRGKLVMDDEMDGIPVKRVWLYPAAGKGSGRRLLNYLSFTVTSLLPLLSVGKTDLIFVEAQPITLACTAWLMKKLRGIPYVYNTPDLQVEHAEEAAWLSSPTLIGMARRLEAFLMREAFSVTTVTHAFMRHFMKERAVPRDRMSFLPNGADVGLLNPKPYDPDYAARMGVQGRKVFTFAGTHAPYQGLEVIIEAAERLQHRDDIVILMVGKGPIRARLIERARRAGLRNVVFGDSPFEEMECLMSITYAPLVTLPDRPTARLMRLSKTIPPLACGVPVIFAGQSESADILERTSSGLCVAAEDPAALADAIETLADDPNDRKAIGQRGRRLAEESFDWSFLVRDWFRQLAAIKEGVNPKVPGFEG